MGDLFSKATLRVIAWRMAIFWFVLFSINALFTATIAALTGTDWEAINNQKRFLIVLAILTNWTGTIMAFVSRAAGKLREEIDNDNTNNPPPGQPQTITVVAKVGNPPPTQPPITGV